MAAVVVGDGAGVPDKTGVGGHALRCRLGVLVDAGVRRSILLGLGCECTPHAAKNMPVDTSRLVSRISLTTPPEATR